MNQISPQLLMVGFVIGLAANVMAVYGAYRAHARTRRKERDADILWRAEVDGRLKAIDDRLGENGFLTEAEFDERFDKRLAQEWELADEKYGRDIQRHDAEIRRVRHRQNNVFASLMKVATKVGVEIDLPSEEEA